MSIRFDRLGINLRYVPKSIQFLGAEISFFGILLTIGMLLGILFVVLEAKRRNQNQDIFLGAILAAALGAIVGGRAFYAGFCWNLFKSNPISILDLRSGGMAYYGALLGGLLFLWMYCCICKVSFGEITDTLTFGALIVQIFTRWGDFFNRESFGVYTEWATAMQIPLASVRSSEVTSSIRENLLTIDGVSWIQVHPAFIYDCLWCMIIFLVLLLVRRKKQFSGEICMRYLSAYGFGRFFIEWLRTDQLWIPNTTLPINLILAAVFFVFFGIMLQISASMAKKRNEAASRRRRELEEVKAAEEAAAAKEAEEPVDIEAILREEELLRARDREEEERIKAEKRALEDAERVLKKLEKKPDKAAEKDDEPDSVEAKAETVETEEAKTETPEAETPENKAAEKETSESEIPEIESLKTETPESETPNTETEGTDIVKPEILENEEMPEPEKTDHQEE